MAHKHALRLGRLGAGVIAATAAGSACALQWTLDNDWSISLDSTLAFGVSLRTSAPDCRFIGNDNGGCLGNAATPLQLSDPAAFSMNLDTLRLNQDDGNLNYKRWQPVAANLQWTGELFIKASDGWSGLLRGNVNRDFAADQTERMPLDPDARHFARSHPRLLDAYVTKEFEFGEQQARVRVGNQVLSWGEDMYISGGVNALNPFYLPSAHQPGTPLKNLMIPAPMVSASTSLGRNLGLEGFYQWRWKGFTFDAPGTFFSTSDFVGRGGRGLYLPTSVLNGVLGAYGLPPQPAGTAGDNGTRIIGADPATGLPYDRRLLQAELASAAAHPLGSLLGAGSVIPRGADNEPRNDRQFGLALRYKFADSGNELGLYYQRYSDKLPFVTWRVSGSSANPLGWEAALDYGRKRQLFGVSYNFQLGEWAIGTELSFRPKDGVAVDPSVVIDPANPHYCNALGDFTVKPVGSRCRGWVDTQHYQWHLTGLHILSPSGALGGLLRAFGASEGTISAETALAYYPKLKLDAGIPYAVTAGYSMPTRLSAGMVVAASLTYPNVFGTRASLAPDVAVSYGIAGISATALPGFIKGANAVALGATLDFKTRPETRLRVDWTHNGGGGIDNLMRDRDFMSVSLTSAF